MLLRSLALLIAAAVGLASSACTPTQQLTPEAEDKSRAEPPTAPLEAKLVANKQTYTLDLGGKTPGQYGDAAKAMPPVVEVDLALQLRNTGDKNITIWIADDYRKEESQPGGDYVTLDLDLKGPGAVGALVRQRFTKPMTPPPRTLALAPGQSYTLPITTLNYGTHGVATFQAYRCCWTQPGQYTLTATFKTAVAPAPRGSKETRPWAGFKGGGFVTVTSAPVKLTVVESGKE
jgi:hypothetical protein